MLLEAALGGLLVGLGVSVVLLRFYGRVPGRTAFRKSILLSVVALLIVTLVIEIPAKMTTVTHDAWRYFVIGTAFNTVRILALGAAVGSVFGALIR